MKAIFEGQITATQPLFHNSPDTGKKCLKMPFLVGDAVVEVPIISPNTMRAIIRDNIACDIVGKIGEGQLDYLSLLLLFSGGIIDKKDGTSISAKQKFAGMKYLRDNNIVVSLLGGCANIMIPGKTVTAPLILICKETIDGGYVPQHNPDDYLPASSYVDRNGLSFIRREDMLDPDVNKYLSEQGMEELCERMSSKKKTKRNTEDNGEGGEQEAEGGSTESAKRTGQMVYGMDDYVIAGAKFYHRIEINSPKEEEIGAIYGALARFSERPVIGSFISKGFGRVAGHYTLTLDNGSDIDNLNLTRDGFVTRDAFGFWARYKEYIDSLTIEKVSIPSELIQKVR